MFVAGYIGGVSGLRFLLVYLWCLFRLSVFCWLYAGLFVFGCIDFSCGSGCLDSVLMFV